MPYRWIALGDPERSPKGFNLISLTPQQVSRRTAPLRFRGAIFHKKQKYYFFMLLLLLSWGLVARNSSRPITLSVVGDTRPKTLLELVQLASGRHHVPPELLWAMVSVESRGDVNALSARGAVGLMQLMPETAKSLRVRNPRNAEENILAGAAYVSKLLEKYHGRTELALAAYNAGPRAVAKHGGVPPYPETRRYVQNVLLRTKDFH